MAVNNLKPVNEHSAPGKSTAPSETGSQVSTNGPVDPLSNDEAQAQAKKQVKCTNGSGSNGVIGPVSTSPVIEVSKSKHLLAAATLSEAFQRDDVARYVVDVSDNEDWPEEKKYKLHSSIMNHVTLAHCIKTLTTATGPETDPYASVALWFYPGRTIESLWPIIASGLWRMPFQLTTKGRRRAMKEFWPLLSKTKFQVLGPLANDCYYLVYIGTKRAHRGKGYAKRLIQDVMRKADEEGKWIYLESSAVVNVKLYESLGFVVKKRVVFPGKVEGREVFMDIMVRRPGMVRMMQAETEDSGIAMESTKGGMPNMGSLVAPRDDAPVAVNGVKEGPAVKCKGAGSPIVPMNGSEDSPNVTLCGSDYAQHKGSSEQNTT